MDIHTEAPAAGTTMDRYRARARDNGYQSYKHMMEGPSYYPTRDPPGRPDGQAPTGQQPNQQSRHEPREGARQDLPPFPVKSTVPTQPRRLPGNESTNFAADDFQTRDQHVPGDGPEVRRSKASLQVPDHRLMNYDGSKPIGQSQRHSDPPNSSANPNISRMKGTSSKHPGNIRRPRTADQAYTNPAFLSDVTDVARTKDIRKQQHELTSVADAPRKRHSALPGYVRRETPDAIRAERRRQTTLGIPEERYHLGVSPNYGGPPRRRRETPNEKVERRLPPPRETLPQGVRNGVDATPMRRRDWGTRPQGDTLLEIKPLSHQENVEGLADQREPVNPHPRHPREGDSRLRTDKSRGHAGQRLYPNDDVVIPVRDHRNQGERRQINRGAKPTLPAGDSKPRQGPGLDSSGVVHDQGGAQRPPTRPDVPKGLVIAPVTTDDQHRQPRVVRVGEMTWERLKRQVRRKSVYVVQQPDPKRKKRKGARHKPRTHFTLSLFTLCFCVSPLGFIAMIFAVLSENSYKEKDAANGRRFSRIAMVISIIGIIGTIATAAILIGTNTIPVMGRYQERTISGS